MVPTSIISCLLASPSSLPQSTRNSTGLQGQGFKMAASMVSAVLTKALQANHLQKNVEASSGLLMLPTTACQIHGTAAYPPHDTAKSSKHMRLCLSVHQAPTRTADRALLMPTLCSVALQISSTEPHSSSVRCLSVTTALLSLLAPPMGTLRTPMIILYPTVHPTPSFPDVVPGKWILKPLCLTPSSKAFQPMVTTWTFNPTVFPESEQTLCTLAEILTVGPPPLPRQESHAVTQHRAETSR